MYDSNLHTYNIIQYCINEKFNSDLIVFGIDFEIAKLTISKLILYYHKFLLFYMK